MKPHKKPGIVFLTIMAALLSCGLLNAQNLKDNPALDEKVKEFLAEHSGQWYDMNISDSDGRLLYDLIIKGNFKSALEIGTSTGRSGIYIAWALSKTGGKLITIDIDEGRHRTAVENFKKAGLSEFIDARLADAHTLVRELKGPFDFVFSDADKGWYKNYFVDIAPKLKVGGCYTTHNVSERRYGGYGGRGGSSGYGGDDYLEYVRSQKNFKTTLISPNGILVSYKIAED